MMNERKKKTYGNHMLSYHSWVKEIREGLQKIGFLPQNAEIISNNYKGLYVNEFHYEPPDEVVERVMNKGLNIYDLPESAILKWEKEHNFKTPLTFIEYL